MRFARRPSWIKSTLLRPVSRSRLAANAGVLLTFDDGPHPLRTPAVLERLRAAGVFGAFFLVGERIASHPELARRIDAEGHTLGNHTYSHCRLGWTNFSTAFDEVTRCQKLLPARSTWLRPPYGRVTPGLWWAARRSGLRLATWTLDSGDWQCRSGSDAIQCAAEVLQLVRPGDTILFHDHHEWIGPILDAILPELLRRGLLRPDRAARSAHLTLDYPTKTPSVSATPPKTLMS